MAATGRVTAASSGTTRWIFRPMSARWACRRGGTGHHGRACPPPTATPTPSAALAGKAGGPHEGVPAEHLLCGNGAADLIFRLVWAAKPRGAWCPPPPLRSMPTRWKPSAARSDGTFLRERKILRSRKRSFRCGPGLDMVFLCQPNNPTGQLTPLALVEALLHRCAACGALLVVDECFLDFLPEAKPC